MRQIGEGIETFGVAAQQFGNQTPGEVGTGDAVAAVALHVIDVGIEATKLRHTRQGQQEVARPAVINFHALQLREGFQQFRHHKALNVIRVARAVDHAAAVQQAVVGGKTVVIKQIVTVFHTVVFRDQRTG